MDKVLLQVPLGLRRQRRRPEEVLAAREADEFGFSTDLELMPVRTNGDKRNLLGAQAAMYWVALQHTVTRGFGGLHMGTELNIWRDIEPREKIHIHENTRITVVWDKGGQGELIFGTRGDKRPCCSGQWGT